MQIPFISGSMYDSVVPKAEEVSFSLNKQFAVHLSSSMSQEPLIHKACLYGELDTLTDLVEVKGIDVCTVNEVRMILVLSML